ncbi:MAG TPA: metallophosphoesterase [Acidimicrobiales bacterium]|nr:metallophosphoesterase [Acidimicrobiales bacterium]
MTVSDDGAVFFRGTEVDVVEGLAPDRPYELHGVAFATLPRPPGARLATVATVNDVHFGEVECGRVDGADVGPVLTAAEGADPYPEVMNRAAAAEIAALCGGRGPDALVAKGDLTADGRPEEYAAFEACYRPPFGERLHVVLGNHDNQADHRAFDCPPVRRIDVPGAVLAVLDTSRPGEGGGRLSAEQLDWLDALAAEVAADDPARPVLAFGHHPCLTGLPGEWTDAGAHLDPVDSGALAAVLACRPSIVGWFAGHTHRNRVGHRPETGPLPYVEVAATKDFPGSWAEYRVFEGGVLQVHHRVAAPAAVAWSEECRALVFGLYPRYALGDLADRCFALPTPGG